MCLCESRILCNRGEKWREDEKDCYLSGGRGDKKDLLGKDCVKVQDGWRMKFELKVMATLWCIESKWSLDNY